MFDCHNDITAFHNDNVTLSVEEKKNLREHRDTNRNRLKSGLKDDQKPAPIGCRTQGSYAMKIITQHKNALKAIRPNSRALFACLMTF